MSRTAKQIVADCLRDLNERTETLEPFVEEHRESQTFASKLSKLVEGTEVKRISRSGPRSILKPTTGQAEADAAVLRVLYDNDRPLSFSELVAGTTLEVPEVRASLARLRDMDEPPLQKLGTVGRSVRWALTSRTAEMPEAA